MNKSAYSFSTNKQKIEDHIIVVWVDNESGVLARVVGLFSGRGYNIDSFDIWHSTGSSTNKTTVG